MSGTLRGIGGVIAGESSKAAADFNADQMEREGRFQSGRILDNTERLANRQRALFATRNISIDQSTAKDFIGETYSVGFEDAAQAMSGAVAKASISRMQGQAAQMAGYFGLLEGGINDAFGVGVSQGMI
jgi:hypothetical protein